MAVLVDSLLPQAPYRQWVLSMPRVLRFLMARDNTVLSKVLNIFLRTQTDLTRHLARLHNPAAHRTLQTNFGQRCPSRPTRPSSQQAGYST